jgi:hypothetical protein
MVCVQPELMGGMGVEQLLLDNYGLPGPGLLQAYKAITTVNRLKMSG